ncbi:transposase family protein [Micromonospora fulviviridis]|uniref:transposase family protein n=1 Tax=Micromonospora fulviviridis TaxID=47860 RepID=UPI0037B1AB57
MKTPVKQPGDGRRLAPDNRAYNRPLRGLRWQGERGFAILIGRWKTLRHTTVSPRRIGDIVAAALHLTHFESNGRATPKDHNPFICCTAPHQEDLPTSNPSPCSCRT